ncbi:MAG: cytochrome b/b6 domain-containing protein [Sphingomonadales bacterium]|nr:cytochrome b/b6 domain-containing protein [Sphingomonadales bacterium]
MAERAKDFPAKGGDLVRRHRLATRIWHWANAAILAVMLMSGLMIFNAHPHLYWGQYGANFDHAWLGIEAVGDHGTLRIGQVTLPTTGVLGLSRGPDGGRWDYAFPPWITIPSHYSLADARIWHFAFAVLLIVSWPLYLAVSLANGHLRGDLLPTRAELGPRHIWHDITRHARLRFPTGAAALRYNILQKLAYGAVLFVLLPLVILTGLAMAPGMDAAWPWLTVVFGGRQSARSIHFLMMAALLGFFLVHIAMVVLAGPVNELRAMITGWYRLPRARKDRRG